MPTNAKFMAHIWNDAEGQVQLLLSGPRKGVETQAVFNTNPFGMQLLAVSYMHMAGVMPIEEIDIDVTKPSLLAIRRAFALFVDSDNAKQVVALIDRGLALEERVAG